MKIKMYYNKNLKMTPGKLAAQCGHVARELGRKYNPDESEREVIIVLGLSATKFDNMVKFVSEQKYNYIQIDSGRTEVPPNAITVCGYKIE